MAGNEVHQYIGWRAIPSDLSERSGVVAMLKVRESWVKFEEVEYFADLQTKMGRKLKDSITSKSSKRRELFEILLRNLAHRQLSKLTSSNEAIIAVDALVVKPDENLRLNLDSGSSIGEIELPSEPIFEFLSAPEGSEEITLAKLGVAREHIPSSQSVTNKIRTSFVPGTAPEKVLAAFSEILSEEQWVSADRASFEKRFGRNEIRDLVALGCLVPGSKAGSLNLVDPYSLPEATLKHRAASQISIEVARRAIKNDPEVNRLDLAQSVGEALGKNWTVRGTKQRHGAALWRWVLWIEPHLVDPSKNADFYSRIERSETGSSTRGRKPIISDAIKSRIRSMMAEQIPQKTIAEELGVSSATIGRAMGNEGQELRKKYGYKQQHPDRRKRSAVGSRFGSSGGRPTWPEFEKLPLEFKIALANRWYGDDSVEALVIPALREAGAPESVGRGWLNLHFGPRSGGRQPSWYK